MAAAIASYALTALLATYIISTCQAFSVGTKFSTFRVNAKSRIYSPNRDVELEPRLQMSVSEETETDASSSSLELKQNNHGIYDLAGKEEHL
jgi:hypothetical protein